MVALKEISKNNNLPQKFKEIFSIITKSNKIIGDSDNYRLNINEVEEIKENLYEIVKENYKSFYKDYLTLKDIYKMSICDINKLFKKINNRNKFVGDSEYLFPEYNNNYFNDILNIGTGVDPTMFTKVTKPLLLTPQEASNIYSNGGLPKQIIDKKAKGYLLNGFDFENLDIDKSKILKENCIKTGFDEALLNTSINALVFGGAILFPIFKKDDINSNTFMYNLDTLRKTGILDKNQIDRWVYADRWNVVIVPNYDLTVKDYIKPKSFFITIAGLRVNAERCAMIKPSELPYWGKITQIGWSISDFVGYYKDYLDYRITILTLPIMFQQMSLLFQLLPLDDALLTGGIENAKEIADYNASQLRKASILNPMAINSVGDIKVIDRTYVGVEPLIRIMRQNLCANAGMQESIIFDPPQNGFSDKMKTRTLIQSEGIKMLGMTIAPQLRDLIKILYINCFGNDDFTEDKDIRITFNPSVVLSEEEKAEKGLMCAKYIKILTDAGFPLTQAIKSAKQYFNFEINDRDFEEIKITYLQNLINNVKLEDKSKSREYNIGNSVYEKDF